MKNKICYLIIDDKDERELLNTAITETELGYEVIMDKSIERAKERFSREPDFHPSYFFIDWNLSLVKYVKGFSHLADVPVIVYTADVNAPEIEELKQLGVSHCLLETTHETALTSILLRLFANKEGEPFVLVYHPPEESRGFLR
jgi:hypothetical protein